MKKGVSLSADPLVSFGFSVLLVPPVLPVLLAFSVPTEARKGMT